MTLVAISSLTCFPVDARPVRRAMYVQDASTLTASGRARLDRLLDRKLITEVVPYGLGALLDSYPHRELAAAWIDELHRHGARVIAPVAGEDRLRAIDQMLAEHPATYLDGMVSEVEFWNRADRSIALEELLGLIADMRSAATTWRHDGRALPVGAYLGYPTQAEAVRIAAAVDFAFLDYSVRSPVGAWSATHAGAPLRQRFGWFAGAGVDVWPIFYATGEVDMSAALRASGTDSAEARFRADLAIDPDLGKLGVAGFVYFTFESMPDPR